jgi:hypothetical protein
MEQPLAKFTSKARKQSDFSDDITAIHLFCFPVKKDKNTQGNYLTIDGENYPTSSLNKLDKYYGVIY